MGFGMSLGCCLSQSQSLSMREALEARLTQKMIQTQKEKLILELRLYQKREDEFKKLYARALKNKMVYQYDRHGLKFEFACLKRTWLSGNLLREGHCGFAHALYNPWEALFFGTKVALARASWLIFTVPDFFKPVMMPPDIVRYVAVHEHGEEVTLGEHDLATKLEFSVSKNEGKIKSYVCWLEENCPTKFVDVFSYQPTLVLPDSEEFQQELEMRSQAEYATHVRKMIEGFEWPYSLLQKLSRYQKESEKARSLVFGAFTNQAMQVDYYSSDLSVQDAVSLMRAGLIKTLIERVGIKSRLICVPDAQGTFGETIYGSLTQAFFKWLARRKECLELRHMNNEYAAEVASLGVNMFPADGVLSSRLSDVLAEVSKYIPQS